MRTPSISVAYFWGDLWGRAVVGCLGNVDSHDTEVAKEVMVLHVGRHKGLQKAEKTVVSCWTVRSSPSSERRARAATVFFRKGKERKAVDLQIMYAVDLRYLCRVEVPLSSLSITCSTLSFFFVRLCPECGLKRMSPSIFSLLSLLSLLILFGILVSQKRTPTHRE